MVLRFKEDEIIVKFCLKEKKIIDRIVNSVILPVVSGTPIESVPDRAVLKLIHSIVETNKNFDLLPCENKDFYIFLAYCIYSDDDSSFSKTLDSLEDLKVKTKDESLKINIIQFELFLSKLFLFVKEGREQFGSENYFNDGIYLSNWKN